MMNFFFSRHHYSFAFDCKNTCASIVKFVRRSSMTPAKLDLGMEMLGKYIGKYELKSLFSLFVLLSEITWSLAENCCHHRLIFVKGAH